MNGSHDTLPNEVPYDEELSAYLDGELDAEARRRFEDRLSSSSPLRQRLKEYQQTWDLLDDLPRATVDDSFTRTTVEMVAVRAEGDVLTAEQRAARRKQRLWILGLLAVLLTAAAGYAVTYSWLQQPNEQLVEDLPILEHFDAYQNAGSVEFLQELSSQGLFREESSDAL